MKNNRYSWKTYNINIKKSSAIVNTSELEYEELIAVRSGKSVENLFYSIKKRAKESN